MKRLFALLLSLLPAACSKPQPVLFELPDFSLTAVEPKGTSPFGRQEMLGRVWLVDFVFTRCGGPCPLMTSRFKTLAGGLDPAVGLLSVTVDPEWDTPDRLREYAKTFGADLERWRFARATEQETYRLLFAGFRLPFSKDPRAPAEARVQHSTRFVLVDKKGRVRRFYDGLADTEDAVIVRESRRLLEDPS